MDANEVRRLVSNVPKGTRLRFTFWPQNITALTFVIGMLNSGMITVENPNFVKALCFTIILVGNWADDQNRTFEVRTTDSFDVDWFVHNIGSALESLEVLT